MTAIFYITCGLIFLLHFILHILSFVCKISAHTACEIENENCLNKINKLKLSNKFTHRAHGLLRGPKSHGRR